MEFYDGIAGQYDDIVGGAKRLEGARKLANWLVESYHAKRVLDVACGTGLHARALAERGVEVVAADASEAMLQEAKAHIGDVGDLIEWVHGPMEQIAQSVAGPFDAVICVGNSLPHLLTDERLRATVQGFRSLLASTGIAVVQILNYNRILNRRERIVGITRHGDTEYVRFYDFLQDRICFNILELAWQGDKCAHTLHQTELRPYRAAELCAAFSEAGFGQPKLYDGVQFNEFDSEKSDGLLLVASI